MRTRDIIGKRIVAVCLNRFSTGRKTGKGGTAWSFDPVLVLDDGTQVGVTVEETDVGRYGVSLVASKPRRKAKP